MARKLSQSHKAWLNRHARLSARRTIRQRNGLRERRVDELLRQLSGVAPRPYRNRKVQGELLLDAPRDFSLTRNYEGVLAFISGLREIALRRRHSLALNFTTIENLASGAALVLAAEVDRWRQLRKLTNLRPRDIDDWTPDVRRQLCEKGFFDLLDVPDPGYTQPDNPDTAIRMIRFLSGRVNDGQLADRLTTSLAKVAGAEVANGLLLYDGLMEAMLNAVQHAYPEREGFKPKTPWLPHQWWISGSYDGSRKRFTAMVYDQGVGIPETLESYDLIERVREWLARRKLPVNHHASMIRAAMEVSRTSAAMAAGRGNGLAKVREIVDESPGGRLRILSGQGEYIYDEGGKHSTTSHSADFGGTLIQWEIEL